MCKSIHVFRDGSWFDRMIFDEISDTIDREISRLRGKGLKPTIKELAAHLEIHPVRCSRMLRWLGIRDQFAKPGKSA